MKTEAEGFAKLWGFGDYREIVRQFEMTIDEQQYRLRIFRTANPKMKFAADCWLSKPVPLQYPNLIDGKFVDVFVKLDGFGPVACSTEEEATRVAFELLAKQTESKVRPAMAYA